ncbi:MAG: hypothetical protein R8G60_09140 [Roseovarius pacificus]|nr:hypothetical protein [Roseovarius pacificus]
MRYPSVLGYAPGIVIFLGFGGFLLADPAPTDPGRLALVVGGYWYLTLMGITLFGPRWMVRGEALTILMRAYARVGLLGRLRGRIAVGLWGWQGLTRPQVSGGLAVFIILMLGTGSFDGVNETFLWMGFLGINPLEFPGRSAVITQNLVGMLLANLALISVFAACLALGERLAGTRRPTTEAIRLFAPSLLPIALAYHIAHYLTVLLVDGQYVISLADRSAEHRRRPVGTGGFSRDHRIPEYTCNSQTDLADAGRRGGDRPCDCDFAGSCGGGAWTWQQLAGHTGASAVGGVHDRVHVFRALVAGLPQRGLNPVAQKCKNILQ